jgi:transcriptional regulator with PAS, ATPase and Fis domain
MQLRTQMEILIEEMLDGRIMLNEALSEFEKLYIQKALSRHNEHLSHTANALGIHRNTLSKRVAGYQNISRTPKRLISLRSKS